MQPQTIESARTDLFKDVLQLREGKTIKMGLDSGFNDQLPDYYDPETVYEVRKTTLSHTKAGLESYFSVVLNRPDESRTADPLFKITISRNVPEKPRSPTPDNPEWNRHWVNHRSYDKFGSWTGQGHHDLTDLTVVDEPPRCPQCGALSSQ